MSRIVYDRLDVIIPVGQTNFNEYVKLREGKCIGVKVIAFKNSTPDHAINLGVDSAQSNEIISATDFRDYSSNAGGYFDSLKPVEFESRGQVNVYAVSSEAVSGSDFKAQVIFAIDTEPTCTK